MENQPNVIECIHYGLGLDGAAAKILSQKTEYYKTNNRLMFCLIEPIKPKIVQTRKSLLSAGGRCDNRICELDN